MGSQHSRSAGQSLLWPASCAAYLALAGTTRHSRPHPLLLPCTDAYDSNIALYYPNWPATFKTWYDDEEFLYDYSNPGFRCGGALRHLHLCVAVCWVTRLRCRPGPVAHHSIGGGGLTELMWPHHARGLQ